jgi:hypothetical protein
MNATSPGASPALAANAMLIEVKKPIRIVFPERFAKNFRIMILENDFCFNPLVAMIRIAIKSPRQ